jgi:hypothetical protein
MRTYATREETVSAQRRAALTRGGAPLSTFVELVGRDVSIVSSFATPKAATRRDELGDH